MTNVIAPRSRVSDLRGMPADDDGLAVLEDLSGRRRRLLRIAGRCLAGLLTLWLVALLLGGIGISPVGGIPFVRTLRPATPPPAARSLPRPAPATADDLQPALPLRSSTTAATAPSAVRTPASSGKQTTTRTPKKRTHSPSPRSVAVHTQTPAVTRNGTPGTPASPNGVGRHTPAKPAKPTKTTPTHTTTTPGHSKSPPGKTKTVPQGNSKKLPPVPLTP